MRDQTAIIPNEYNDIIYRATYFFLGKVAHLVPDRIKPNHITYCAFFSALLGCFLLWLVDSPVGYLYWALFNFIWYILDALDGIHARLTQQASEYGAFLDHFLDTLFFMFMFTVFTFRFDLLHLLYIFILLLRSTAATSVFIVQVHTGKLYLGKFSGGLELTLMTATMILSYFYPHVDPTLHTQNSFLLYLINLLDLQQGLFMKIALLFYIVGVPITFILQIKFVKKNIHQPRAVSGKT